MNEIDKSQIVSALEAQLNRELAAIIESQRASQSGATHEESRQEDSKDTRAIEASYLARGLAQRVDKLRDARDAVAAIDPSPLPPDAPITVGALVEVAYEPDKRRAFYYVVPLGGGESIEIEGQSIKTLTPLSPLGRSLLGRQVDDDIEFDSPQGVREVRIVAIR